MSRKEFPRKVRLAAFARANGCCEKCTRKLIGGEVPEYDHILPDALGGKPTLENCQILCAGCHAIKTGKEDVPRIRKSDRQRAAAIGAKVNKGTPMKGPKFTPAEPQRKASKPMAKELPPRRAMFQEIER